MPESMPSRPRQEKMVARKANAKAGAGGQDGLSQAGCCVQVCTPFGCKCILDLPVCP
jgi:hypothetical protein